MANLGVEARNATLALFGRYTQAKSEGMRTLQGQFVRQVAVPVALGILQACEGLDQDDMRTFTCTFGDFFQKPGQPQDPKGARSARQAKPGTLTAQAAQAARDALQKDQASDDAPAGEAQQPEEDASSLLPNLRLSPRPQQGVASYFQGVLAQLGAMFGIGAVGLLDPVTVAVLRKYTVFPLLACALSLPLVPALRRVLVRFRFAGALRLMLLLALFVGSVLFLIGQSYNPFIYFRF